ncbi:MAG TPA: hypothetical protein VNQ32_09765 [Steroidobacteraceae bacterium]|nr:hypothetical protein [Steroidobacteraceae bacterium]
MTVQCRNARLPVLGGRGALRRLRSTSLAALALLLAACGSVAVKPTPALPRALVQPLQARVGLVVNDRVRNYKHEEKRGNSGWKIDLGPGHEELFRTIFGTSFSSVQVFDSEAAARSAGNLQAIFEPEIEQFSFVTDSETGGEYWAVTIRYRIAVLGQAGEAIDNLTLTGYGSSRAGRAANALTQATRAAMRDAAAKFLVQLPRQPMAARLAAGEVLTAQDAAAAAMEIIELVPIEPDAP